MGKTGILLETDNGEIKEANFGVIDAQGGAAYYETTNFSFTKIDANDPVVAPFGYLIRTNYSFTGTADDGYGPEGTLRTRRVRWSGQWF